MDKEIKKDKESTYKESIISKLIQDESFRLNPYKDSKGYLTGGIGHKFTEQDYKDWNPKWNVDQKRGFWAEKFEEDLVKAKVHAIKVMHKHEIEPTEPIQDILTNMVFNLGPTGVNKFPSFLKALKEKDAEKAVWEMKNNSKGNGPSQWYKDVPNRVDKLAEEVKEALGDTNEYSG